MRVCSTTCDVAAIKNGVVRLDQCQFCYSCVDHCPNGGLRVVDMWSQESEKMRSPRFRQQGGGSRVKGAGSSGGHQG